MTFIIAIAGGSGAGKTILARALAARLAQPATLISEDHYYHCRTSLANFDPATHDFDHPDAKDHALLARHLTAARRGEAFEKPLYAHERHERIGVETVSPAALVILEGLHVLAHAPIRAAIDLAVYVEADEAERLARRMARDVTERGRTPDGVKHDFARAVAPAHERFVAPQAAHADLVVINSGALEEIGAHAARIEAAWRARSTR